MAGSHVHPHHFLVRVDELASDLGEQPHGHVGLLQRQRGLVQVSRAMRSLADSASAAVCIASTCCTAPPSTCANEGSPDFTAPAQQFMHFAYGTSEKPSRGTIRLLAHGGDAPALGNGTLRAFFH